MTLIKYFLKKYVYEQLKQLIMSKVYINEEIIFMQNKQFYSNVKTLEKIEYIGLHNIV